MPCLWPRPERGSTIAQRPGSPIWIAMPLAISALAPAFERQRCVEHRAQIESRGRRRGVIGQRKLAAEPRVEHLERDAAQCVRATLSAPAPRHACARRCARAGARRARACRRARAARDRRTRSAAMRCRRSSKPSPSPTLFAAMRSMPFFSSLARAWRSMSSVSAAKPTTNGRCGNAATSATMSGFCTSVELERLVILLLDLLLRHRLRPDSRRPLRPR